MPSILGLICSTLSIFTKAIFYRMTCQRITWSPPGTQHKLVAAVEKLKKELTQKNILAAPAAIAAPIPKMCALISILESTGKAGYSPDLGSIKFVMSDNKLIVRVAQGAGDRAETLLGKAILEEEQANGQVYYVLDKNMVEVDYKQE